jgi:hypothetical protein
MGGALLLRPDGEFLCFPWDGMGKLAPESDAGWRLAAVVAGAEKYPELRPLDRSAPRERQTVNRARAVGESALGTPATVADPSVDAATALDG